MKSNIFIPKIINVGYQNRSDTYTKKLAYVIYYDEKGTLRKETSWNSWRDKKIDPQEFDNVPTSGFVLNKKVGDYASDWNHRQAYVRVYDPRNFEFEITIENLLYILENASSIKGKGLEGNFVYGWDGKDLILIPIDSPDYIEITKWNNVLFNSTEIKGKDLIVGATYRTKQNEEWIYIGRYDYWDYEYLSRESYDKRWTKKGKKYYFYDANFDYSSFSTIQSIKGKIIDIIDDKCVSNYADIFDKLERNSNYSPVDDAKNVITNYTLEEFLKNENEIKERYWGLTLHDESGSIFDICFDKEKLIFYRKIEEKSGWYSTRTIKHECTLEEFYDFVKPVHLDTYLQNGKFYERKY